jgi:hypothetical protein
MTGPTRYGRPAADTPRHCQHGREQGRFCSRCVCRARAWARHGDAAIGRPPRTTQDPATFGLSLVELRAEANRLWTTGWAVGEICQVLEVEQGVSR